MFKKMLWFIIIVLIIILIIFIVSFIYYETIDNFFDKMFQSQNNNVLHNDIKKLLITGENKLSPVKIKVNENYYTELLTLEPSSKNRTILITSLNNSKLETDLEYDIVGKNNNFTTYSVYVNMYEKCKVLIMSQFNNIKERRESIIDFFYR